MRKHPKRTAPADPRRLPRPTASQLLRQLGVILAVTAGLVRPAGRLPATHQPASGDGRSPPSPQKPTIPLPPPRRRLQPPKRPPQALRTQRWWRPPNRPQLPTRRRRPTRWNRHPPKSCRHQPTRPNLTPQRPSALRRTCCRFSRAVACNATGLLEWKATCAWIPMRI